MKDIVTSGREYYDICLSWKTPQSPNLTHPNYLPLTFILIIRWHLTEKWFDKVEAKFQLPLAWQRWISITNIHFTLHKLHGIPAFVKPRQKNSCTWRSNFMKQWRGNWRVPLFHSKQNWPLHLIYFQVTSVALKSSIWGRRGTWWLKRYWLPIRWLFLYVTVPPMFTKNY